MVEKSNSLEKDLVYLRNDINHGSLCVMFRKPKDIEVNIEYGVWKYLPSKETYKIGESRSFNATTLLDKQTIGVYNKNNCDPVNVIVSAW